MQKKLCICIFFYNFAAFLDKKITNYSKKIQKNG